MRLYGGLAGLEASKSAGRRQDSGRIAAVIGGGPGQTGLVDSGCTKSGSKALLLCVCDTEGWHNNVCARSISSTTAPDARKLAS